MLQDKFYCTRIERKRLAALSVISITNYRAKCFVDKLAVSVRTISQLYIRVALPQDHYPTQEQMLIDIAHEMNR